jgi:hypothetical protein
MAEELFSKKRKDVSLSAHTVARRNEDTGDFTFPRLINKCQCVATPSLALDESSDTCDTAQLLIFLLEIDAEFEITEELAELQSLKGNNNWKKYIP